MRSSPEGAVTAVDAAVDTLLLVDWATEPGPVVLDTLAGLLRAKDRLEAVCAALTATAHTRGDALAAGAASTASWLRRVGRLPDGEAGERVRFATRLRTDLRATGAALAAGRVGYAAARALAGAATSWRAGVIAGHESELLALAAVLPHRALLERLRMLREAYDPDGTNVAALTAADRAYLHVSDCGDVIRVDGDLDPLVGTAFRQLLEACTPPPAGNDPRTSAQRRAEALGELCRRAAAARPRGRRPPAGAQLLVLVDTAALTARPGPQPGLPARPPAGELLGHGPLTRGQLDLLTCTATARRVLLDPAGEILDLGRARRTVSTAQWHALVARDRGCVYPGCDRPPAWCDAHHRTPWHRGGRTDLRGLALLCRRHHTRLHLTGHTLTRSRDGTWTVTRQ